MRTQSWKEAVESRKEIETAEDTMQIGKHACRASKETRARDTSRAEETEDGRVTKSEHMTKRRTWSVYEDNFQHYDTSNETRVLAQCNQFLLEQCLKMELLRRGA